MLDHNAQTDLDEPIAAQENNAGCDLQPCRGACEPEPSEERIKAPTEQLGQRLQTAEQEMVGTWGLEPQTSTVSR